jgi:hypothetical protein
LRRYAVVEFLRDGEWHIHKYRFYEVPATKKPPGDWIVLNELPEAPPLVVGPGGDFDKQVELEASFLNLLKALQGTLKCTGEILKQLLAIHAKGEKP